MYRLVAGLAGALFVGGLALSAEKPAAPAAPLKVLLVAACDEYQSSESLGEFQKFLEARYNVACTRAFGTEKDTDLPGLQTLDTCDVLVVFTRRFTLPPARLERLRKYCDAGRPVVGLRTASHAFKNWPEFDKEVLGGDYQGHYGKGPKTTISLVEKTRDHPILAGFRPYVSASWLYKNPRPAADIEVLLTGSIPDHTEPLAWTRVHKGGRVFYTSLGAPEDFADESFRKMITSAIFWTAKRNVEAKGSPAAPPGK